jgi:hypothetical protein
VLEPPAAREQAQLRRMDPRLTSLERGHVAVVIGGRFDEGVEDRPFHGQQRIK